MDDCCSYSDLEEKVRNYERLLTIVTQEKDLALEMVRSSAQKIGQLEQVLNSCEDKSKLDSFKHQVKEIYEQMQKDYSEAIVLLEKKLACVSSDLHVQAKKVVEKNGELEKLQVQLEELAVVQESLKNMENREEVLQRQCRLLENKCLEYQSTLQRVRPSQILENEVDRLTQQLHLVEQQRNELQSVLEKTQNSAEALAAQEAEARNKVSEAITIVETTLVEKQQAQHQLMLSENECKRLQKELIDIIEEAGVKVKKEVEEVRKSYQDQLQTVQSQMNLLEKEKNKRINQIENLQAEITRLEKELDEVKRKSVSPRKLQALNEQLHVTEANLLQLQVQNKSLNEIIMQNQHRFESEISKCGIERRFLEKQILQLQADLTDTGGNLERAVEHCNQLSEHLQKLSSDLINERAVKETDNTELLKQLKITRIHSNSAMQELKRFVTTHNDITNRWKEEYLSLTEKFNEKMKQLKLQNKIEKRRNKKLVRKLVAKSSHEYDIFREENDEENDGIDDMRVDSCDELVKSGMNDNNVNDMHGTCCSCND